MTFSMRNKPGKSPRTADNLAVSTPLLIWVANFNKQVGEKINKEIHTVYVSVLCFPL